MSTLRATETDQVGLIIPTKAPRLGLGIGLGLGLVGLIIPTKAPRLNRINIKTGHFLFKGGGSFLVL